MGSKLLLHNLLGLIDCLRCAQWSCDKKPVCAQLQDCQGSAARAGVLGAWLYTCYLQHRSLLYVAGQRWFAAGQLELDGIPPSGLQILAIAGSVCGS